MNTGIKPIDDLLGGLTGRQKLLLGACAAGVAGLLWLFTSLLAKPPYAVLYKGLSPSDAQMMEQRLAAQNVAFEVAPDGSSLSVPAAKLDRIRMQMAAQGLPQTGQMGWEIFDKPNWVGSDFDDQVNYQRALEGELERSILTLNDIEAVRVHLVLPHDSLFSDAQQPAKAAVVVKARNGQLGAPEATAIRRLVAGAVEALKPAEVTVVDADGDMPLAPGQDGPGASEAAGGLQAQLEHKVIAMLTPILGAGEARANVTVQYDLSTREVQDTTYNPQGAVLASEQKSQESVNTPGAMGLPGAASNVPGPQAGAPGAKPASQAAGKAGSPAPAAAMQGETRQSESASYVVSHQETHEVDPAGRVQRITAAVVVDDAAITKTVKGKTATTRQARSPQQMQQISDLVKAAIGFNAQRGDQVVVENIPFLPPTTMAPAAPTILERVQQVGDRLGVELHYAMLLIFFLLAYLLLIRPLFRALAASPQRRPQPALAAAATRPAAPAPAPEPLILEEAPPEARRIDEIKKQVVESVRREPETNMRLIRHWIREGEEG